MFIAIATEDFLTFTNNNEAEVWTDYTDKNEYPIFTGTTIEETRNRVKNYFHTFYDAGEDIPEYKVCEITTAVIIKGTYKLNISCDYVNNN